MSGFGPMVTRKMSINWSEFGGGTARWLGFLALVLCGEGLGMGLVKPEEEMAFEGNLTEALPVPMGSEKRDPGCFQQRMARA